MRPSIWDILSIVMILGTLCLCGVFGTIFTNANSAFNPFPPPTDILTIFVVIPTYTPTFIPRAMPPTWTPVGGNTNNQVIEATATLLPSSTLPATATGFVIASFTPSPTITNTATATPTITLTRTITSTKTATKTRAPTNTPLPPTNTPKPTNTVTPSTPIPYP